MNKQSNTYTVIYAAALVLVVGVVLSLVYQAMRPAQLTNIANDKRKQILSAVRISPQDGQSIEDLYNNVITDSYIVNDKGEHVESETTAFDIKMENEVKKSAAERLLPVFVAKTEAGTKYILPCYGAGLWGPIWGYIAFDDNGDTIYGAYFSHQGETPGLGAEIEKPKFQDQFQGKNVFSSSDEFLSIAVEKSGQKPAQGDYVDAVSGGTITSKGVQSMLLNSLAPYTNFLLTLKNASKASAQ